MYLLLNPQMWESCALRMTYVYINKLLFEGNLSIFLSYSSLSCDVILAGHTCGVQVWKIHDISCHKCGSTGFGHS